MKSCGKCLLDISQTMCKLESWFEVTVKNQKLETKQPKIRTKNNQKLEQKTSKD